MFATLAIALSLLSQSIPFFIFRKVGIRLGTILSATLLGLSICILPMARSIARLLAIFYSDQDPNLISFYFYNSFLYDLIYLSVFLFSFWFLSRWKYLYFFLPLIHIKLFRKIFAKLFSIPQVNKFPQYIFFFFSLICLTLIISISPVHLLWLADPRSAYIIGRSGIGLIFILFILFTNLSSYYIAKQHYVRLEMQDNSLLSPKYLFGVLTIIIISFFSGTKSLPLSVILTQLAYYLVYSHLTFKSILFGVLHRLRLHAFAIIFLIVSFLAITFALVSLSGTSLATYITEESFLFEQINFVQINSESNRDLTNLFARIFMISVPSAILNLLNLGYNPVTDYTAQVLNLDPTTMVNFPAIDLAMFSKYLMGPFFFVIPIISSLMSALPFASLYRLCSITNNQYRTLDHNLLMCSFALSFLPLIHPLTALNVFALFSLL